MSEKAVIEFEERAALIMKKRCDTKRTAINRAKETYELKRELLPRLTLAELVGILGPDHCPLCDYYDTAICFKGGWCPLRGRGKCCREWDGMWDCLPDNRPMFRYWFNKLYERIMAL